MKEKPVTPYQRLLEAMRKFAGEVEYPKRQRMWVYAKNDLGKGWDLTKLNERALAAQQLGFDILLKPTDEGLEIWYVQKRPERPWELR